MRLSAFIELKSVLSILTAASNMIYMYKKDVNNLCALRYSLEEIGHSQKRHADRKSFKNVARLDSPQEYDKQEWDMSIAWLLRNSYTSFCVM